MSAGRYAVYYAPDPASALWHLGAQWLGRDAFSGECFEPMEFDGLDGQRFQALTAAPRRYGFHATLKAPMRLANGASSDDLLEHATLWAARRRAFEVRLRCDWLHGFLALRPASPDGSRQLSELAADCVGEFERFRRPMSRADLARRLKADLSTAQEALLLRWGYPYVFDEYRFHMTLSARVRDARERELLAEGAWAWFGELIEEPLRIHGVSVFHEPDSGAPFELVESVPFGR